MSNNLDTNIDLDMAWVKEYSRIHFVQQIMNREEIDSIVLQTIYMNTNREITKIDKETIKLNASYNTNKIYISKEQILQLVQTKKVIEKTKYALFDMLLFTVDLDPTNIQKYVNGECNETSQLKSIHIIDDIVISPSLFIFHSLHTFFLLFIEKAQNNEANTHCIHSDIKSILKTQQNDNKKTKQTKKVRISEGHNTIYPKKTRKIWDDALI